MKSTLLLLGMVCASTGCATEPEAEDVVASTETGVAETPYYGCWAWTGWSSWVWGGWGNGNWTEWKERNAAYGGRIGRFRLREDPNHDASGISEMYLNYGPSTASGFKIHSECKNGAYVVSPLYHFVGGGDTPPTHCGDVPGTKRSQLQVLAAEC